MPPIEKIADVGLGPKEEFASNPAPSNPPSPPVRLDLLVPLLLRGLPRELPLEMSRCLDARACRSIRSLFFVW